MITMEDLKMRRYVMLVDRSGSMSEEAKPGSGQSRWKAAEESTVAVARKIEELGGSLDVYTFNEGFKHYPNAKADVVANLFKTSSPAGGTDFVPVLSDVFDRHFTQLKTDDGRPTIAFIVTDGQPSAGAAGQKALAKLIIETTKKMEADAELGCQFLQIGNDKAAQTFLQTLDDDLQSAGAKFDIIDTKTADQLNDMSIEEVLLAAVND